jgi:hypothetical protein
MPLMARLRRIEAGIEWLEIKGMLRLCTTKIKRLELKRKVEASLARNPGNEIMRDCGVSLGVTLPPLPKPPPPAPVVRPLPPAPPPPHAQPHPEESGEARRLEGWAMGEVQVRILRDAVLRTAPRDEVVRVPSETHDIPEHMQIRPVQWRQRGPQDVDDWDEDGPGYGQCLTDYDPLADEDS